MLQGAISARGRRLAVKHALSALDGNAPFTPEMKAELVQIKAQRDKSNKLKAEAIERPLDSEGGVGTVCDVMDDSLCCA